MEKPSYLNFNIEDYPWKADIDYRKHPELYRVGKGEQGVLICEPYKSEIGQHWRFKNADVACESSEKITAQFLNYLADGDFVGADMARKYLQMGFTRARRYANYKGGRKYDKEKNYQQIEKGTGTPEKAEAAAVFYKSWKGAEANTQYTDLKKKWKEKYG
ncbi:cytoplasmic protein [Flavobacterium psychrophilum]|nr:cytoplasmic protein [Flavobacterium psychrophilum]AOE53768.1 cytoplasmic protein [Flavobacterium psychrophilum]